MVTPNKQKATPLAPRAATTAELGQDLAAPAKSLTGDGDHTGAVRRALDDTFSKELTPAIALRAMRCGRDLSDVPFFVQTAMEILRRSPHLQSLLQTRTLAVISLPLIAEQGGKKLVDRKAAEAAQEILVSEPVESNLSHLALLGAYLGFSLSQSFVDTSNPLNWTLADIREVEPHFITFNRTDARTPYLLPIESGGPLQVLPENKYIYHRPGLISGNPVTSGIAYAVLFYEALKGVTLNGWVGFVELFGQPIRIGEYPAGMGGTEAGKKDLKVLKSALQNLGGDAWAMLPTGMKIEIIEAAGRNGSAEVYEKLCRFTDEQEAKLVLGGSLTGGTGNTGSGGSQGLGVVHNELRIDILRADAKALANTLRRCLIAPFTKWNIAGAAVPKVYFQIEEAEDIAVKVKAVCDLADRGFKVPAAEMYALLDIRAPEGDEDVIGAKAAPPAPAVEPEKAKTAMSAQFSANADPASGLDELDALGAELLDGEEYTLAAADADEALLSAIEGMAGGNGTALKAALIAAIRTGDVSSMQAVFAAGTTAARLAGDMGAEIGMGG